MALRDVAALREWLERDHPPRPIADTVTSWVRGLDHTPWQAPSVPFSELSFQPESEVRLAVVPGTGGVHVFYRQIYDRDVVDLIWVGSI